MAQTRKVVLVTGCSKGGIGFYLCEEYASRGCIVYATARNPSSMEGFSLAYADSIRTRTLDVGSEDAVNAVVKDVIDHEGRIDILINNAGLLCIGPLTDVTDDRVRSVFDTNVFAALRVARAVIPHMAARKSGLVVNVGSVVGEVPTPWNGIYCATKAALHSLSEVLKMECAPFNIKVTVIIPGAVKSNISSNQSSTFRLPDSSLYTAYLPGIMKRMNVSQTMKSMPTNVFARQMVDQTLKKNPPFRVSIGGNTWVWTIFTWIPRSWALWYIWRLFRR